MEIYKINIISNAKKNLAVYIVSLHVSIPFMRTIYIRNDKRILDIWEKIKFKKKKKKNGFPIKS
jgi:hypothetical protein